MNDYEKQAQDFLDATGCTIEKKFLKCDKYFPDDKESRNIWEITMKRGGDVYTFKYGDSIFNTENPILPKGLDQAKYNYYIKHGENETNRFYGRLSGYFLSKKLADIKPKEPTNYDILACLDVVYEDNFEDWCSIYGYNTDSKTAEVVYNKCLEQDRGLRRLFDRKELEMLAEIN